MQMRVGEEARADRQRPRPGDAGGLRADHELGRAPADVDDARAVRRDTRRATRSRRGTRGAPPPRPVSTSHGHAGQVEHRGGEAPRGWQRRGSRRWPRRGPMTRPALARSRDLLGDHFRPDAHDGGGIAPPGPRRLPRRVKARSVWISRRRPSRAGSATSSRVVFDPMSMHAQRTRRDDTDAEARVIVCGGVSEPPPSSSATCASPTATSTRCAASTSTSRAARCSACSGPTAPGKTTTVEILEGYRNRTRRDRLGPRTRPRRAPRGPCASASASCCRAAGCTATSRCARRVAHWARCTRTRATSTRSSALVGLQEKRRRPRAHASPAARPRRLDLALALVGDPELVFLDEPTTGFDPEARRAAWDTVRALADLGKTILLTTHYLDEAQALCRPRRDRQGRPHPRRWARRRRSASTPPARYRVAWRDEHGRRRTSGRPTTRRRCCTS